jgi:hypothetical protein
MHEQSTPRITTQGEAVERLIEWQREEGATHPAQPAWADTSHPHPEAVESEPAVAAGIVKRAGVEVVDDPHALRVVLLRRSCEVAPHRIGRPCSSDS